MIDASALSSALTARALVREGARIAALEADIRERAAFNRRLKAQEWLRQRAAEIDAFHREQARIAEEAVAVWSDAAKLLDNLKALQETIDRNKPSGAKGRYWKSLYITSTMGPSVEVDVSALQDIKQEG